MGEFSVVREESYAAATQRYKSRKSRRDERQAVATEASETGIPFKTALPDSGSIASWSVSTFEFTPVRFLIRFVLSNTFSR